MPENPFLLVMIADIAAKQRDFDLAATSARDALRYLEHAEAPSQLSRQQWPQIRDRLRATALFVQGRVAAHREQYKEAEQSLLASLTLNPDDMEALYTIGVVRMAVRADEGAARAFARVAKTDGPLAAAARESLRVLYARNAAAAASDLRRLAGRRSPGIHRTAGAGDPDARGRTGTPDRRCAASATRARTRAGSRRAWRGCSGSTVLPTSSATSQARRSSRVMRAR